MDWKTSAIWAFKFLYAGGVGLVAGFLTWVATANTLCGGIILIMAFLTKKYLADYLHDKLLTGDLNLKTVVISLLGFPAVGLEMILVVGAYKWLGWESVIFVCTALAFAGLIVERKVLNPPIVSQ